MDNNKNDFQVYALEVVDKDTTGYVHWAEGLTLYIIKDGVKEDGTIILQGGNNEQQ